MLSHGTQYLEVPRTIDENLQYREWILRRCLQSKRTRLAVTEGCKHDFLYFCNTFSWQFNPKKIEERVGPFITWNSQDRFVQKIFNAVEQGTDLVAEKSREEGASWLCVMAMDWLARTQNRMQFLMVSRIAELVDGHTPDALFWKIDYIHDHLPEWMKPNLQRLNMYIGYKDTNTTVTGMASTGDFAVGGRATAIFMDEFGKMKNAQEAYDRSSDTSNCRIFNFTHTGPDTAAYRLSQRPDVEKVRLHWSDNPRKNYGLYQSGATIADVEVLDKDYEYPPDFDFVLGGEPGGPYPGLRSVWYDAECKRRNSSRAVAMDLDIDPKGASDQFFDAQKIREFKMMYAQEPTWTGDFKCDQVTGEPSMTMPLVRRSGGLIHLWMEPEHDGTIAPDEYVIGSDVSEGTGATPSCVTVANARTHQKVLEYVDGYIKPHQLAPFLVGLCKLFKQKDGTPAKLVWECPGPGQGMGKIIIEMGFRNIYYRTNEFRGLVSEESETPGWYTSSESKRWLLEEYRTALQGWDFENRSAKALDECLEFRYVGNTVEHAGEKNKDTPSAGGVNHGDRVITDALAWMLVRKSGYGLRGAKTVEAENDFPYMSLGWRRKQEQKARRSTLEVWI